MGATFSAENIIGIHKGAAFRTPLFRKDWGSAAGAEQIALMNGMPTIVAIHSVPLLNFGSDWL